MDDRQVEEHAHLHRLHLMPMKTEKAWVPSIVSLILTSLRNSGAGAPRLIDNTQVQDSLKKSN
jgi:hypothetical protein